MLKKRIIIGILALIGLTAVGFGYLEYDRWYNPAQHKFNAIFSNFLGYHQKKICSESLGGMTDASPRTFYHVYYNLDPSVEQIIFNNTEVSGFALTEDKHAEKQRVPGYDEHERYFVASSANYKVEVNIASSQDKVTLYCGSLGNYQNYGKTISPASGQEIVEFRVTKN